MTKFHRLLAIPVLTTTLAAATPGLDEAEVKLPYGELKKLLTDAARPEPAAEPLSALLSARLRVSIDAGKPVVDATFASASFGTGLVMVPLLGGNLTMMTRKPADSRVLIHGRYLCQALEVAGSQVLEARLLPAAGPDGFEMLVPACPSAILETGNLGTDGAITVKIDGREQILGPDQVLPLPLAGGGVGVRLLGEDETREALRPPEPSAWTWQHQALVLPGDGGIAYHVMARASATNGSGVAAQLTLPQDAREVTVTGRDLAGHKVLRGEDRALNLTLEWKTRGVLERDVELSYQLPRRPLDRKWTLQAPGGPLADATRTRFVIASSATLAYAAENLTGPFEPEGLPDFLKSLLKGESCFHLEAAESAALTVNPLPLVATADGSMPTAQWSVTIEPDGAMLVKGTLTVEHRKRMVVALDTPAGLTLLSCQVGDHAVAPVNLGEGRLEVTLPGTGGATKIECVFTGRTDALDPVDVTLTLALPQTPLSINALVWGINLPAEYIAETNGNLTRTPNPKDAVPSQITLRKNLCRDERPEIHVFYRRAGLKH
ncbi:MAG: hypothetical protein WCP45_01275 [Verrucomicrobiota bacterium]